MIHWLISKTEDRISKYHRAQKANQSGAAGNHDASAKPAGDAHKRRRAPENAWKSRVKAPVAEHAWETLCNSIVQEVTSHSNSQTASAAAELKLFFGLCSMLLTDVIKASPDVIMRR